MNAIKNVIGHTHSSWFVAWVWLIMSALHPIDYISLQILYCENVLWVEMFPRPWIVRSSHSGPVLCPNKICDMHNFAWLGFPDDDQMHQVCTSVGVHITSILCEICHDVSSRVMGYPPTKYPSSSLLSSLHFVLSFGCLLCRPLWQLCKTVHTRQETEYLKTSKAYYFIN